MIDGNDLVRAFNEISAIIEDNKDASPDSVFEACGIDPLELVAFGEHLGELAKGKDWYNVVGAHFAMGVCMGIRLMQEKLETPFGPQRPFPDEWLGQWPT